MILFNLKMNRKEQKNTLIVLIIKIQNMELILEDGGGPGGDRTEGEQCVVDAFLDLLCAFLIHGIIVLRVRGDGGEKVAAFSLTVAPL